MYISMYRETTLADEVVVNCTKLFWFKHFFYGVDHFDDNCKSSQVPFQHPQSWQLCRWPISGDTGPQLQWCDTIWHWKRPQAGAQQIDTQYYPPLTHLDGSGKLWMDDKHWHTHTHKKKQTHTHTQYKVLPSQRTLSKMLSAKWPQGSNLGELHRYESVNAANTPKLTRSRYRYKEHPKGKRKPQPAVWIRLIVDCASLCQVRTDTAWHYFFPEMHATSSVR